MRVMRKLIGLGATLFTLLFPGNATAQNPYTKSYYGNGMNDNLIKKLAETVKAKATSTGPAGSFGVGTAYERKGKINGK